MCGISLCLHRQEHKVSDSSISTLLRKRGPDSFKHVTISPKSGQRHALEQGSGDIFLTFTASVLSLRGDSLVEQPVFDDHSGSVLCWNGEAWQIDAVSVADNDTVKVFSHLLKATSCVDILSQSVHLSCDGRNEECRSASLTRTLRAISSLTGPYAFIFFDGIHQRLFFARDPLGRRSLVYRTTQTESFVLASVADGDESKAWREVQADGVYVIDVSVSTGIPTLIFPNMNKVDPTEANVTVSKAPWITHTEIDSHPGSLYSVSISANRDCSICWTLRNL